ncbi:MAG: aldehyde dehydrogenase family protein, partial [Alcaligenaceae bacterium]
MSLQLVSLPERYGYGLVYDRVLSSLNAPQVVVANPATGQLVAKVPMASAEDAQAAVDAAEAALAGWKGKAAAERGALLERWFQLITDRTEDLAHTMVLEQGKPLAEARGEVAYAASFVKYYGQEATRIYGEVIPSAARDRRNLVVREPVGVCAAITPWNFPAAMVTRKAAPALAAGCTMVIKPSELTPLTALLLVQLALEAGIPPGVLNIVVGDAVAIGNVLTSSPLVRMLSFTGSTRAGIAV